MKKIVLPLMAVIPCVCKAQSPAVLESENDIGFRLINDINVVSVKDAINRDWYGGCYTQNPTVRIGYECDYPDVNSISVAVMRCNGIVKADDNYMLLENAVEKNANGIDIVQIIKGDMAEFDVSVPGRYCLAYCVSDKDGATIETGSVKFDSLYDDGNWKTCGEAKISSGVLSSEYNYWHTFLSNGTGFLEDPGDLIWWECPMTYPYYSGEQWSAPIEYHPIFRMYRIVDPFTNNKNLKDYLPEDSELLSNYYPNVAYTPEAFIFDRENPSWFLLNAEWESAAYCEPMRTGIVAMHRDSPYSYIAHPYNENVGYVIYDVCPQQDIKSTGRYLDMPLDNEIDASIIVEFPGWSSIQEINIENKDSEEYFTIEGIKTDNPEKGFFILRQGSRSYKIKR